MPIPAISNEPIERPNFLLAVWWSGTINLYLHVAYPDSTGRRRVMSFRTEGKRAGDVCLPSHRTIHDLRPEALKAPLSQACLCAGGSMAGTSDFASKYIDGLELFWTAAGQAMVVSHGLRNESLSNVAFRAVSGGNARVVTVGCLDLCTYSFSPSTQLWTIPGEIKRQFPTYVHDPQNRRALTELQKRDVTRHLEGMTFTL